MRSTKASAAIERLKKRSGNNNYSMSMSSGGLFSLILSGTVEESNNATNTSKSGKLCQPMPIDEFVAFVNAYGPQTPKRVSKLDIAFNEQLARSRNQQ